MSNSVTRPKGTLKTVSASIFFKFFYLKSNRGYLTLHCKSFHLQILNFQKIGQKCNFKPMSNSVTRPKGTLKTVSASNFFQIFLLKIQPGIFGFALQKFSFTNIEFSKNWTKMQFANQCQTRSLDLKVPLKPFLLQFFSNFFA